MRPLTGQLGGPTPSCSTPPWVLARHPHAPVSPLPQTQALSIWRSQSFSSELTLVPQLECQPFLQGGRGLPVRSLFAQLLRAAAAMGLELPRTKGRGCGQVGRPLGQHAMLELTPTAWAPSRPLSPRPHPWGNCTPPGGELTQAWELPKPPSVLGTPHSRRPTAPAAAAPVGRSATWSQSDA